MPTFYKATFSNGRVITRSTASRKYSCGYLTLGVYRNPADGTWSASGFSSADHLAHKAMAQESSRRAAAATFAEVAPAIEITAHEYRTARNS